MARDSQTDARSTAINRSVIDRVSGAVRGAIYGWFGPGLPVPAVAQQVAGRAFDYPTAVNTSYTPRAEQSETGITFEMLRRVADPAQGGLDLLRLAIETRKDQMALQEWTIAGRDGSDGGATARAVEKFLRRPDGVTPYRQWQRMLLEDCLVIDAMAVYHRSLGSGALVEPIDGATIKRILNADGRVPMSPDPAYQQVLKGVPAVDYTIDELTYFMRNQRTNRIYGFSPVEQVVGIVNIALRRQLHIVQYFTEGNIPEMLIGVPEQWNAEQIRTFQEWWDTLMEGNTAQRRHAKFIPGGMQPHETKNPELKGEVDEWLSRVICYAFSLSPESLVKQTNRATAETAREAAAAEGLEPYKQTWKDMMDELLERALGVPDLEFSYHDEEITNPKIKAEVVSMYVEKRIITQDEGRVMLGMPPLTPAQKEELRPPPPVVAGGEGAVAPASSPSQSADEGAVKLAAALVAELVKKKPARRSIETAPPSAA
jgi:hypothetical protein